MADLQQKLTVLLKKAHIDATEKQITQLIHYVNLLVKWNKAYNLTSIRDPKEMLIKHILDSLVVSPYLEGKTFIDVGTGAGLPGIPLAILNPEKAFTLLDSLGKRIRFLKHVVFELQLTSVFPVQSRVEDFSENQFDGVISRAFSSIKEMLTLCVNLPNEKGLFYALKGIYPENEINELTDDFLVQNVYNLSVPELNAERHLVVLSKKNKK